MKFELEEKDYKLLMNILKDAEDDRGSMSCNDPYNSEEKMFTEEERIKMQKFMMNNGGCLDYEEEDIDGFMCNFEYVNYIILKMREQEK